MNEAESFLFLVKEKCSLTCSYFSQIVNIKGKLHQNFKKFWQEPMVQWKALTFAAFKVAGVMLPIKQTTKKIIEF